MVAFLSHLTIFGLAAVAIIAAPRATLAANPCGLSPSDWCRAPAADPCGGHPDERSCRADPRCVGMRYRGESVVACRADGRGFWTNCPAVGCITRGAQLPPQ
jgi:hypothetical protein